MFESAFVFGFVFEFEFDVRLFVARMFVFAVRMFVVWLFVFVVQARCLNIRRPASAPSCCANHHVRRSEPVSETCE